MSDPAVVATAHWLATHHGVITRARARQLGMSDGKIDVRLRRGEWVRRFEGVYTAAGCPATPEMALLAALAAGGRFAVASHLSAAWLWGMTSDPPAEPWITGVRHRRRRLPGVRVSRSASPGPVAQRQGMPCTGAIRTLIDCANVVAGPQLSQLVDRALLVRAVDLRSLRCELEPPATPAATPTAIPAATAMPTESPTATPGPAQAASDDQRVRGQRLATRRPRQSRRRGRGRLRVDLRRRGYTGGPAPSLLESRMSRLLTAAGVPAPRAEVQWGPAGEYRLDFAYPALRLAIEVDGYAWHSSPERMRADQRRRNALVQSGITLLVYMWRDVTDEAPRVVAEIRAAHRGAARRSA